MKLTPEPESGADLGGGCAPPLEMKHSSSHRSVTSFLRGAPSPKKNPGSAHAASGIFSIPSQVVGGAVASWLVHSSLD